MIYILAQGKGSRWSDNMRWEGEYQLPCEYKQLIPVLGEPNIMRTVRLLRKYGREDFMIIAEGEMFTPEQIDMLPNKIKTLRVPGNILDGVSQLLQGVTTPATFLLGDVIFSERFLQEVFSHDETFYSIWGRFGRNPFTGKEAGEIFAITTSAICAPLVKIQTNAVSYYGNKLWDWFHDGVFAGKWMSIEGDWTDDIDSQQEYEMFFEKVEDCASEEDYENFCDAFAEA